MPPPHKNEGVNHPYTSRELTRQTETAVNIQVIKVARSAVGLQAGGGTGEEKSAKKKQCIQLSRAEHKILPLPTAQNRISV